MMVTVPVRFEVPGQWQVVEDVQLNANESEKLNRAIAVLHFVWLDDPVIAYITRDLYVCSALDCIGRSQLRSANYNHNKDNKIISQFIWHQLARVRGIYGSKQLPIPRSYTSFGMQLSLGTYVWRSRLECQFRCQ